MAYIELTPCPICGAHPEKVKESMGRPGGHGYPGNYTYQYQCEKCGLLESEELNDIYYSPESANDRAKLSWNKECQRVLHFMENR